jgi:hypothetical protein
MRKLALQVEHKFKNRVVGVHMIDGHKAITTIGSARTADIRVIGDDIAGLHAAFEIENETWSLSDLGSESGTWINKKPIIEHKIDGATVIHIGNHQLKATPHMLERELFNKPLAEGKGALVYHQVVIFKKGLLQKSLLLDKTASFNPELPGFTAALPAPKDHEWTETAQGNYLVKQRLTKADRVEERVADAFGDDWKRPAPIAAALLMLALVFGMIFMIPQKSTDEMKTLTPDMQNQYTRLIFDGQKVKQKKAIAERLRKNLSGQSQTGIAKNTPGGDAGAKTSGASKAPVGAKVVVNLKNAGLSALIGKVAARASRNAQLVQAAGVSADTARSGHALGIGGGTSLDKVGQGGGTGAQSARVGGLGTAGKGGGVTGYKGTGALALGKVGTADVGVIEEETEVDGGLDKEAIARVIRSQLGQIRYCYERQLSANPDLYGKILVKFTIGAAGSVTAQAIGNTSLNNAMVEGCILRRIAGWQFPNPKGGTNVLVTYPFLFKSTR